MTIIATTPTVMGCDTLSSNWLSKHSVSTKVTPIDEGFIGCAGSWLLLNYFKLKVPTDISTYEDVFNAWEAFGKWCKKKDHLEGDALPGAAIFTLPSGIYVCQSDRSVIHLTEGYAAIGSGAPYALGSLHSTKKLSDKTRVRQAVEAACAHNPYCGGDVHLYSIDDT